MKGTYHFNFSTILATSFLVLSVPSLAFSDDFSVDESALPVQPKQTMEDVAKAGSAAGFDKRLPPVIPGENIQHNGRTMKVWSSAGPVPVGPAPVAPQAPQVGGQLGTAGNIGVIVDQRHRQDLNN
jgi:hypothetical protein